MSSAKEPHYYNTDLGNRHTATAEDYLRFFDHVTEGARAVGEASVWYLYSEAAVPNIVSDLPDARFIVMLRNPVEMAPSLHEQQVVNATEDVGDFEAAWRLQNQRAAGRALPALCEDQRLLLYGPVCRLGEQLQRLYTHVPRDRVLTLLLDDVKADPRGVYLRVLEFLQLQDDGRSEFSVANAAKSRRWPFLRRMMVSAARCRTALGLPRFDTGLYRRLDRLNLQYRPRLPISVDLRRELIEYFHGDVQLLASLLDRDLAAWQK